MLLLYSPHFAKWVYYSITLSEEIKTARAWNYFYKKRNYSVSVAMQSGRKKQNLDYEE